MLSFLADFAPPSTESAEPFGHVSDFAFPDSYLQQRRRR